MQQTSSGSISVRKVGRSDAKVSILGFGGHHLGDAPDEKTAVRIVQEAVDGGITFYDNCWEYRRGKTELWMGCRLEISGNESIEVLNQNLAVAVNFQPLTAAEMQGLREPWRKFAADGRYELFKTTTKYDGRVGCEQHHFPAAQELPL
jgi:hypothetical protein